MCIRDRAAASTGSSLGVSPERAPGPTPPAHAAACLPGDPTGWLGRHVVHPLLGLVRDRQDRGRLRICGLPDRARRHLYGAADRRRRALDACLLYTSDAADDLTRVDLGGRRIIKK